MAPRATGSSSLFAFPLELILKKKGQNKKCREPGATIVIAVFTFGERHSMEVNWQWDL